mmetsp:Transcript_83300/g.217048  ORF Transcript_83300/g.217048 Transcript_83300/m.217048 type:complete len:204 (-) Transcript_83300:195-806(-)
MLHCLVVQPHLLLHDPEHQARGRGLLQQSEDRAKRIVRDAFHLSGGAVDEQVQAVVERGNQHDEDKHPREDQGDGDHQDKNHAHYLDSMVDHGRQPQIHGSHVRREAAHDAPRWRVVKIAQWRSERVGQTQAVQILCSIRTCETTHHIEETQHDRVPDGKECVDECAALAPPRTISGSSDPAGEEDIVRGEEPIGTDKTSSIH